MYRKEFLCSGLLDSCVFVSSVTMGNVMKKGNDERKELEETKPSFTYIPAEDIPYLEASTLQFRVIAGEAFGKRSPIPVHSPTYLIEIKSTGATTVNLGDMLYSESASYILEGSISRTVNRYIPKQILIPSDTRLCAFMMAENTDSYLFGRTLFPEDRYIDWSFVSSSKARLARAKEAWIRQEFPKIQDQTEFVPYPTLNV